MTLENVNEKMRASLFLVALCRRFQCHSHVPRRQETSLPPLKKRKNELPSIHRSTRSFFDYRHTSPSKKTTCWNALITLVSLLMELSWYIHYWKMCVSKQNIGFLSKAMNGPPQMEQKSENRGRREEMRILIFSECCACSSALCATLLKKKFIIFCSQFYAQGPAQFAVRVATSSLQWSAQTEKNKRLT